MKKGIFWTILTCLILTSLVLGSCVKTKLTPTSTQQTTTLTTTSTTTLKTTSTTTLTTTSTTPTTTISGNWWDKLGKPQYGGTTTIRYTGVPTSWDNYNSEGLVTVMEFYQSRLFADQWTMDPAQWDYAKVSWRPDSVTGGDLAQSWEFSDPTTFVVHLRQGVHWQNIDPANGREFVADDVVFNNNRLYGLGGMPGSPVQMTNAAYKKMISVTATDKYTVVFKWSIANPTFILSTLQAPLGAAVDIMSPDAIKKWGNINDWHQAIGTGPFIVQDYVSASSVTLARNPNYFGHDERYPQNQIPYVDGVKILIIPDDATGLSALRTGKIDAMVNLSYTVGENIKKSNPEISYISLPATYTISVDPRGNTPPFDDIRVRKAMQLAIDLPSIAKNYYSGSCSADPSTLTSNNMGMGWGYPYSQWPQSLKDEYRYDPAAAKKLLADAGYPNGFKTNIVADAGGDMDLLQIVKSYFLDIGIDMLIRPMPTAEWAAYVNPGHKQDQLSQRQTGFLGVSFDVDRQMQRFVTGSNWNMISDPTCDSLYAQSLAATTIDEYKKAFNAMNKYIAEQHFVVSLLTPTVYSFYQPWFKGFMAQDSAMFTGSGARLGGYYHARFWIDQKMKKSMGH